ncbi:MAG: hypothetical protein JWO89_2867, partial [Verrucomicrobiaceae bacterium]|nr:hypothetical protein [Verrucomicrobiaceae bacterium]
MRPRFTFVLALAFSFGCLQAPAQRVERAVPVEDNETSPAVPRGREAVRNPADLPTIIPAPAQITPKLEPLPLPELDKGKSRD